MPKKIQTALELGLADAVQVATNNGADFGLGDVHASGRDLLSETEGSEDAAAL